MSGPCCPSTLTNIIMTLPGTNPGSPTCTTNHEDLKAASYKTIFGINYTYLTKYWDVIHIVIISNVSYKSIAQTRLPNPNSSFFFFCSWQTNHRNTEEFGWVMFPGHGLRSMLNVQLFPLSYGTLKINKKIVFLFLNCWSLILLFFSVIKKKYFIMTAKEFSWWTLRFNSFKNIWRW